jgi:hypothetical protein
LIASAIPVSARVTEVLVITDDPSGIRGKYCLSRGIEISDNLDTEPVLFQRYDRRLEHMVIRQRGEVASKIRCK